MKVIDIQEKNTDAFCRDVVSVTTNYKALLRKPERKINDTIRLYRVLLCMDVILLVMFGADFISVNGLKVIVENNIDFNNIRNVIIASTMLILGLGGAVITITSGDFCF